MRGIDKDLATPNIAEAMKIVFMIGDVRLLEETTGVSGDVYILDASVATPSHFAKFTPSLIKKFLICAQEAYPVKLKEVHVVNVSSLVDTIVNFVKPFLKEKIKNRIFFHADGYESLYKYVPKEMLPQEYGGFAGPIAEMNGRVTIPGNRGKVFLNQIKTLYQVTCFFYFRFQSNGWENWKLTKTGLLNKKMWKQMKAKDLENPRITTICLESKDLLEN